MVTVLYLTYTHTRSQTHKYMGILAVVFRFKLGNTYHFDFNFWISQKNTIDGPLFPKKKPVSTLRVFFYVGNFFDQLNRTKREETPSHTYTNEKRDEQIHTHTPFTTNC